MHDISLRTYQFYVTMGLYVTTASEKLVFCMIFLAFAIGVRYLSYRLAEMSLYALARHEIHLVARPTTPSGLSVVEMPLEQTRHIAVNAIDMAQPAVEGVVNLTASGARISWRERLDDTVVLNRHG